MFEKAVRLKVRWDYKGLCSVEDLWDLTVQELDTIFKGLNARLKEQEEESLLEERSPMKEALQLKVDIIKHIVEVKLAEQKAKEDEAKNKARKQKLLEVIAEKQDAELYDLDVKKLQKMADAL